MAGRRQELTSFIHGLVQNKGRHERQLECVEARITQWMRENLKLTREFRNIEPAYDKLTGYKELKEEIREINELVMRKSREGIRTKAENIREIIRGRDAATLEGFEKILMGAKLNQNRLCDDDCSWVIRCYKNQG